MDKDKPIILAITAASGFILGIKTLEFLLQNDYNIELIISQNAYYIAKHEINIEISHNAEDIKEKILSFLTLEDKSSYLKVWLNNELWANPASGSYKTNGMIITPMSMSSLASISCGIAENLISRAADVVIKEGRPLIIVPRETPFSVIHLENMLKLAKLGVKIVPPSIGFYSNINSIDDCLDFIVGKTLDAAGIEQNLYKRWNYE